MCPLYSKERVETSEPNHSIPSRFELIQDWRGDVADGSALRIRYVSFWFIKWNAFPNLKCGSSRVERRKLRRKEARQKNKNQPAQRAKRNAKRQAVSQEKLALRQESSSHHLQTQLDISSLKTSIHGNIGPRAKESELQRLQEDQEYRDQAMESYILVHYRYECKYKGNSHCLLTWFSHDARAPTYMIDSKGFKFGFRSFRHSDVTPEFIEGLLRRIDDFAVACKMSTKEVRHKRGDFAQVLLGKTHGTGEGDNVSQHLLVLIRPL